MERSRIGQRFWYFAATALIIVVGASLPASAKGIGGSMSLDSIGSPATGPCSDTYANVCPSGTCICQEYQGKLSGHFGGRSGRGSAQLSLTVDDGLITSSPDGCRPVFGVANISTPIGSATINVTGAFCDEIGKSTQQKLQGGFGLAGGSFGEGLGTFNGNFNTVKDKLTIKFSGQTQ
jgi:hypothetical protein